MKVKELIKALKRANGNDNVLLTIARPDERGIKHGYLTKVTDVFSLMGDTIIQGELDIIDPIESTESVVKRIMERELTDAMKEEQDKCPVYQRRTENDKGRSHNQGSHPTSRHRTEGAIESPEG